MPKRLNSRHFANTVSYRDKEYAGIIKRTIESVNEYMRVKREAFRLYAADRGIRIYASYGHAIEDQDEETE